MSLDYHDVTDRGLAFEKFCGEWKHSAENLALFAHWVGCKKDVLYTFDDGFELQCGVWTSILERLHRPARRRDFFTPYSYEVIFDQNYRPLIGTMTEAEDIRFFEAWREENEGWMRFAEAIAQAAPSLKDEAYVVLSKYCNLRDCAIEFFQGAMEGEDGRGICNMADEVRSYFAEVLLPERDRLEKDKNEGLMEIKA